MINVLYVGGKEVSIPQLAGSDVNLDYVQNGMIALSAIQTGDFDEVMMEDQVPLMTPSRLLKELVATNPIVPVISIVRGKDRKKAGEEEKEQQYRL